MGLPGRKTGAAIHASGGIVDDVAMLVARRHLRFLADYGSVDLAGCVDGEVPVMVTDCRSCRNVVVLLDAEGTVTAGGCWNHRLIKKVRTGRHHPAIPITDAWPLCLGDKKYWQGQPGMFDVPRIGLDGVVV